MQWKSKAWKAAAAMLIGLGTAAPSLAQTDEEVWPNGVNGPKVWPPELSNPWSNQASNYRYPEGGDPPPINLLTERIKCRSGTKIRPKTYNSAPWETSRHHPPSYAFDEFAVSRWSSNNSNEKWLAADLGSVKAVNQVFLIWEVAYGKDYNIQFSNDSIAWTTAKEVRGGNGQADVVDLEGSGRYIRMMGVATGSPYGYSLYEFTICQAGGSGIDEAGPRQGRVPEKKRWRLVMGSGGFPAGVRAIDARGRTLSTRP